MVVEDSFKSLSRAHLRKSEFCHLDYSLEEMLEVHVGLVSVDRAEDEVETLFDLIDCGLSSRPSHLSWRDVIVDETSVDHHAAELLGFQIVVAHAVSVQGVVVKERAEDALGLNHCLELFWAVA